MYGVCLLALTLSNQPGNSSELANKQPSELDKQEPSELAKQTSEMAKKPSRTLEAGRRKLSIHYMYLGVIIKTRQRDLGYTHANFLVMIGQ